MPRAEITVNTAATRRVVHVERRRWWPVGSSSQFTFVLCVLRSPRHMFPPAAGSTPASRHHLVVPGCEALQNRQRSLRFSAQSLPHLQGTEIELQGLCEDDAFTRAEGVPNPLLVHHEESLWDGLHYIPRKKVPLTGCHTRAVILLQGTQFR